MSDAQQTPGPRLGLDIRMAPMKLSRGTLDRAKRLMGFDYGTDLFHVLCFDFGSDGGAIGIWRQGDDFCARISLDALAELWLHAKANAAIGKAAGGGA